MLYLYFNFKYIIMKATTKVDVIQVEDNLEEVKAFVEQDFVVQEDESFVVTSCGKNWKVQKGDFIVKNPIGFLVYKPDRFEKDFKIEKK